MYKKELEELKSELEEVRRRLTMEHSHFGDITRPGKIYKLTESEISDFIREKTRLWRETWILHPLARMIERCEDCLTGVTLEDRYWRAHDRKWGARSD
jgi:hypothetical protein